MATTTTDVASRTASASTANGRDVEAAAELVRKYHEMKREIAKVIVGQDAVIDELMIALLARGHCLLVGVPGLAKTLLIRTVSSVLDLAFSRIQFTPDLMPSDITGTEILEQNLSTGAKEFRFIRGPIFANIILADEINRTPPKTQAALLEAMQEHHVTAANVTYTLTEPFFVLATQNPIEQEGTYPLPEAQLDRFMFNLWLDYPSEKEEIEIVRTTTSSYAAGLSKIMSSEEICKFQDLVRTVPVADNVIEYAVRLVAKTRSKKSKPTGSAIATDLVSKYVSYGAGPRASQYLVLGAKVRAILDGRYTPSIEDVRALALPVLRHRIITNFNAEAEGLTSVDIIERLVRE
ncbi:MAG: MoxR family ATPase [Bacteroidota bacterium]|nr:MoxR family ATPase [Bacteroidota bacterium]MDP4232722.1 MoxR family ATPase [Bacteroidota bacterium]MDP4243145.1 MoxR family ATPase [Bacteroidota bacterium]MDP4287602.1 MoxR family ATPase [Bacteroidota bacterium]